MKLDISMRTISTPTTSVFTGSFPVEYTEETLRAKIAEGAPDVDGVVVEILSASPQQTCAFLMCHISQGLKLETYLRSIGFTYPAEPSKVPPAERVDILNGRIAALQKEIDENEAEIRTHKNRREDLLYTIDYFTMRTEKYDVLGRLWQSPHVFLITGYIPAENAEALKTELTTTQEAYVELCDPSDADDVPVKLKNNKFAAPVEGVLESYSMPGKHEIDPSGIMAVFYYFLFGMMLSDAGYGLVMVLGCGIILHKFKNMEEGLRKTLTMFLYCGISTIFWGILFGSFFGDAITVIAKTFFNTDIVIPPLWFTPVDEPMRLAQSSTSLQNRASGWTRSMTLCSGICSSAARLFICFPCRCSPTWWRFPLRCRHRWAPRALLRQASAREALCSLRVAAPRASASAS